MKALVLRGKSLIINLFIVFPVFFLFINSAQAELKLISPSAGMVIPNNAPMLTWSVVPCNYYEIWMDGIPIDSIKSTENTCVPFPLSFGKHTWQVIAVDGSTRIKSKIVTFTVEDSPLGNLPEGSELLRNDWKMQSSLLIKENGAIISSSAATTRGWYSTSIPVTVLSALVRNGVYPNPYIGLNNMRIPDSNDKYNKTYGLIKYSHIPNYNPWKDPYWFRTEFEVPVDYNGKTVWLNFSEINYRAEIWLNGKLVADTATMVGMERQFVYDVTSLLQTGGKNYLAVAIYPLDIPGEPAKEPLTPLGEPGTNMADGMISKNYTKWDAIGWDWQPAIRDREMGITEDVFLSATNAVQIENLYVTSDLPLPDTTSASIQISADIINHSGKAQEGTIKANITINNEIITFEHPFSVGANHVQSFLWNAENLSQLLIKNPKLWWPSGYGMQNLYVLRLEAVSSEGELAKTETKFGIRKVETYIGSKERVIKINGQEIYCRGGNWVIDMMLNWNAKRYEDEILLTKNANLNILRVWGPTGAPPQAFYDAADKHGILIWQDFLYDFWGTFRNKPGYATRDDLYEKATVAIVRKYRNHPSLILWCGGNEGPNPREALIVNKILPQFDGRDSRFYLKLSNGDGLHGGGPYHTLSPQDYFSNNKLNGFSSEIGPSGVPVLESVKKFMPELGNHWMDGRFPIDGIWAYHDANDWPGGDTRKFSSYDNIIRQQYGSPASTDEKGVIAYFNKAQLLNYNVYRASIESINRQLWTNSSGILLWKTNSSWPSMVWQLYDWYLQAHAGYYGAKNAGEPVHIQFNSDKADIDILNNHLKDIAGVQINAALYNTNLEIIWHSEDKITLNKNSVYKTGWVVPVQDQLCFLRLTAKSTSGVLLSDNFYWLNKLNDYTALNHLAAIKLTGKVSRVENKGRTKYMLTLTNGGDGIALMIACKLQGSSSSKELLPSLWNKNYISLFPKETIQLEVDINNLDIIENPVITCKAYNMDKPLIISIK
jgi:hypothetical protein